VRNASTAALGPGVRIGRYELVEWIGEGGYAEVWLATLRSLSGITTRVALKIVRRSLSRDPHYNRQFLDEGAIAAKIDHPNVAKVLELGEDKGLLYLAMEYVSGGSLAELLDAAQGRDTSLPPAVALRIVTDVAKGLHAAHELTNDSGLSYGLVHRDVSPQNILLSEHGVAKLIDFGVARGLHRRQSTKTGVTKGKAAYMAPEQARAGALDRRADVWSLAAVLFEAFEGVPPMRGETEIEILRSIAENAPCREFSTRTPVVLRDVLLRALAVDMGMRYPTVAAFRKALEAGAAQMLASEDDVIATMRALGSVETSTTRAASRTRSVSLVGHQEDAENIAPSSSVETVRSPSRPSWRIPLLSFVLIGTGGLVWSRVGDAPRKAQSTVRTRTNPAATEPNGEESDSPPLGLPAPSHHHAKPTRGPKVPKTSSTLSIPGRKRYDDTLE
jgi:eukaryotic-like serine/threonine-protein kinase